jgi:predicted DNA binding CopG/RHH family protein
MTKHRIKIPPEFKSREEEANFWDTHDVTDYFDTEHPIKVNYNFPRKVVSLRLDDETSMALRKVAQQKGIGMTTLIRMWLRERLFS